MNLSRELIIIGREFKINGSACHGDDYTKSLRAKYPNLMVRSETVTRALRKLREENIFHTPEDEQGYFYLNNLPQAYHISQGVEMRA